jgi:hypothetical protein
MWDPGSTSYQANLANAGYVPPPVNANVSAGGGAFGMPNFMALAREEAELASGLAKEQNYGSRTDQFGPSGSSQWEPFTTVDPTTGQQVTRWRQRTALGAPEQLQKTYADAIARQRGAAGSAASDRLQGTFTNPTDYSGFQRELGVTPQTSLAGLQGVTPTSTAGLQDVGITSTAGLRNVPEAIRADILRQRGEDASYRRARSRLDPRFREAGDALRVRLRSQGLRAGDQAYDAAMANFTRDRNDAYQQALDASVETGRREADQMFGQQYQHRGQEAALRGQQFGERTTQQQQAEALRRQQFGERTRGFDEASQLRGQQFGERNTLFGQGTQQAAQAAALRGRQEGEALRRRYQGTDDLNAILRGFNPMTSPSLYQGGTSSFYGGRAPDLTGAAATQYQGTLDQQAADDASSSSGFGGFLGAAASIVPFLPF